MYVNRKTFIGRRQDALFCGFSRHYPDETDRPGLSVDMEITRIYLRPRSAYDFDLNASIFSRGDSRIQASGIIDIFNLFCRDVQPEAEERVNCLAGTVDPRHAHWCQNSELLPCYRAECSSSVDLHVAALPVMKMLAPEPFIISRTQVAVKMAVKLRKSCFFRAVNFPEIIRFAGYLTGADVRNRTADLLITSELLYQLSYVGKKADGRWWILDGGLSHPI